MNPRSRSSSSDLRSTQSASSFQEDSRKIKKRKYFLAGIFQFDFSLLGKGLTFGREGGENNEDYEISFVGCASDWSDEFEFGISG
jgi:hypothetical protein